MTKLAPLTHIDLGDIFPQSTLSRSADNATRPIQQQQRQDSPQLAEIKRQQQQSQSLQL